MSSSSPYVPSSSATGILVELVPSVQSNGGGPRKLVHRVDRMLGFTTEPLCIARVLRHSHSRILEGATLSTNTSELLYRVVHFELQDYHQSRRRCSHEQTTTWMQMILTGRRSCGGHRPVIIPVCSVIFSGWGRGWAGILCTAKRRSVAKLD